MSSVNIKTHASGPVRFTGNTAIARTIVEDRRWKVRDIKLHLSAVGGSGNFTMIIDSIIGSAYDTVIFSQDMTSIYDLVWVPKEDIIVEALDTLNIAWSNPQSRTYGLEIRVDFL